MKKDNAQKLIQGAKGNKVLYDEIKNSRYFKIHGESSSMSLLFCIAVAIGFREDNFKKSPRKKEWITRRAYIEQDPNMMRFLESVAITHDNSLEILSDISNVFNIAERYADGGITKFNSMITGSDEADFDKQVESIMNEILNS